jgi:predicted RNase H-like nuclease (RuvC/YqgF family)
MLEKEELRKKIKQLKYKIEKEEGLNKQLQAKANNMQQLQKEGKSSFR